MKALASLVVSSLLILPSAFAQDCLENICVNDRVISSNNRIGTVKQIVDGKIKYQSSGFSYTASASDLARQIEDPEFARGKFIIDANNRVGSIIYYFENGKTHYRSAGFNYTTSGAVIEVDTLVGFKKGKKIVDSNNRIGTVLRIFKNRKVQYQSSGFRYVTQEGMPEVDEYLGLKAGIMAIDANNRIGKVLSVYKNGKAQYQSSGFNYVSSQMIPESNSENGITKGTVVIDVNNRIGKARLVFGDGRIQYQSSGFNYVSKKAIPSVTEVNGMSKDKVVIDTNNRVGVVKYAFRDGRIQYQSSGFNYVTKGAKPEVDSINGISKGIYVIDTNNRVGKVKYAFEDGRVQYQSSGFNYISKNASPEVETHDDYKKDTYYATESFDIGKVKRFFENGKIQLKSISSFTSIQTKLYMEARGVGGIQLGDMVVDATGSEGETLAMFENGALLFEYKIKEEGEEEEKVLASVKIYGINEQTLEYDKVAWINSLTQKIRSQDDSFSFIGGPSIVTTKEKLADVKKEVLTYLLENPRTVYDKKTRKKVILALGGEFNDNGDDDNDPTAADALKISLNDARYTKELVKIMKKTGLNYSISQEEADLTKKGLSINIKEKKKFFLSKCSVDIKYNNGTYVLNRVRSRTVMTLFRKRPCRAQLRKSLKGLFK